MPNIVTIIPANNHLLEPARQLSEELCLPWQVQIDANTQLYLLITPTRLELHDITNRDKPVFVDFISGPVGYRRSHHPSRRQPLARALAITKQPEIIDATGGFGKDAFILACLGGELHIIERSPVIFALLRDGLQRARQHQETSVVANKIKLTHGDARRILPDLLTSNSHNTVYLDPMYPPRSKSALVKKEMRMLAKVVGHDGDAAELLQVALSCKAQRVVVKRPRYASPMVIPTTSIQSKTTRYDIYLAPQSSSDD